MAKVQAKKAAASSKKGVAKRPAVKSKPAAPARKPAKAVKAAPAKSPSKKTAKPAKPSKAAKAIAKAAAKAAAKPSAKTAAKPAAKPVGKAPAKATVKPQAKSGRVESKKTPVKVAAKAPAKPAAKSAPSKAAAVAKSVAKNVARVAAAAAAAPVMAKAGAAIAARVVPVVAAAADKKRTRRARPRVQSNGVAVANWFVQDKPRPSSFIPAPARAEAPSLVAAPPASSDRLIRPEDINHLAVRTVPVRVDVEQGGGRVFISINPQEVTLRSGEGIEWDFRYLGGADVIVDELVIDFDKPSPFGSASFRSHKPGSARPHRQLSGAVSAAAAGKRVQYTIRAISAFKTELASTKPWMNVLA